jgi:hypothetical protein
VFVAVEKGPGSGAWILSNPDAHGLKPDRLAAAADTLGAAGKRQGLVVVRAGEIAFKRYWANPWRRDEHSWQTVSFSSGKSWGGAMVGRANPGSRSCR